MPGSLTVVVADDSVAAREVRDVVLTWARAGLVGPSVWVSPSGVSESARSGPAHVMATEVSAAGEREEDLFVLTGVRRLDTVRVVLAQLLTDEDAAASVGALGALGQRLADWLRAVLPHQDDARGSVGTDLLTLNVVVPTSAAADVPRAALRRGWDVNAVVAAEDRPDLDRGSVFVRHPGNFVGHAASALAGAGGLWTGVHEGALDDLKVDSTTMEDDVVVCRIAVRAVLGEDLPLTVSAAAVAAVTSQDSGPARYLRWAREARDVEILVNESSAALLRRDPWRASAPPEVRDPVRGHRAPKAAFRDAVQANARIVRLGVQSILGRSRQMMEDAVTGALVGHDADYAVRLRPATAETLEAAARQQLRRSSDLHRGAMLEREAVAAASPPPSTWDDLRRLSFSLLDGGQRPSWANERSTEVAELLPPHAVVASPWDELLDDEGRRFRSYDLEAGRDVVRQAEGRLVEIEEQARYLRAELEADQQHSGDGAHGATAETNSEDGPIDQAAAEDELRRLDAERERVTARRDAAGAWLQRRERSLIGHLADQTTEVRCRSLRVAAAAYEEALDDTPPSVADLRYAQHRLLAFWILLALSPLGLAVVLLWLRTISEWSWSRIAVVAAVGLVMWVLAAILTNHQYYRACRRYAWSLSMILARRRRATEEYVAARREANRVGQLHTTLLDWSEILGGLVHRTWREPQSSDTMLSEAEEASLPAAVAVAQASSSENLTSWHLSQVVERLCPRGWLTAAYSVVLGLPDLQVMAPDGGVAAAIDADAVEAESSPREALRRLVLDGSAAMVLTERAVERVREDVRDERIRMPDRSVRRSGPYSDGLVVSDDAFLSSLGGAPVPFAGDQWTDTGLQRQRHLPGGGAVWLPPAANATAPDDALEVRRAHGDVAVRIDRSRRCRPDDLRLFAPGVPWTVDVTAPLPRPAVAQSDAPHEQPWN